MNHTKLTPLPYPPLSQLVHDTGEAHGQAPGRMGELLGQFSVATFKTSESCGGAGLIPCTHAMHSAG